MQESFEHAQRVYTNHTSIIAHHERTEKRTNPIRKLRVCLASAEKSCTYSAHFFFLSRSLTQIGLYRKLYVLLKKSYIQILGHFLRYGYLTSIFTWSFETHKFDVIRLTVKIRCEKEVFSCIFCILL